jgi:polyferredoxin
MDLLRQPHIATILRWRHLRVTLQTVLLAVAALVVLHGLTGPDVAPRNLATVLTTIHWRGLLMIALVVAGNVFCAACPMVLVRDAGRRLVTPRFRWPRRLRRKWLALGLLVLVLFGYELYAVWERPAATAWLVLGYFGVALLVDLTFRGASFCKYVCPIGQFNFVASTVSPAEIQVRDVAVCAGCRTSDCVKGRFTSAAPKRLEHRGCELGLFLPAKVGNLDCTLCLDCVHACPRDNIALVTRVPALEWVAPGRRSALGRLTHRRDLATLAVVFTFASLVAAFAMTAAAVAFERWIADTLGARSAAPALAVLFVGGLVAAPAALLTAAAAATQTLTRDPRPLLTTLVQYAYCLVPVGVGVWLAHYAFHLLTGLLTIVPVAQTAAIDLLGWPALGEPAWQWIGLRSGSVFPIQVGSMLLGAMGSLGLVWAVSRRDYPESVGRAAAPWALLVGFVAVAAFWILAQPMDMRGMAASG